MDLAKSKIEYQQLKISVARSKIDQQRTLFDSGYGDESALLQAQIEECTARIELEQQKLALANAYYTIRYLTG
jgi:outer membrane protein TolC